MSKKLSTALCLAVLVFSAATPIAAIAAEDSVTGATGTTTVTPADPSASEAPLSMTPEEIAALQGETTAADSDSDKSLFDKVSDFVTDNAPFIIIGIIVLAAILAGIFIMRGRNRKPKAPKGAKAADPGAPASVPSASEIRRRKRAAMQRSREEERLRRKAGLEGRQTVQGNTLPLSANLPADPVEAEKQSARDQLQAAAAVARSGPVPAPASPTQTAPAPGVVQPEYSEPDTALTSATPTPEELTAATAAATGSAPQAATPAVDPEAVAPVPAALPQDPPIQVYDVPSDIPDQQDEPPVEAPGLDARVGEAAAAFAAGAAGGGLAARAAASGEDEQPAEATSDPEDDAARDAEQRLRAKVAEIKAEQGRGLAPAPVPPAPAPPAAAAETEEPASMDEQLNEAEEIQREIESAEVIPPTPTGLAAVEQRLQERSDERDRTLREAESRLRRIEQRAEDAERRAAFAERLAQLKIDESERERRLDEVITGIDRAEERAIEAEERARAAEETAASALEDAVTPSPKSLAAEPAQPSTPPTAATPPPAQPTESTEAADETPAVPAARSPLFGSGSSGIRSSSGSLNLNNATFEELRDADLSVTQATRILAYRERFGGYRSVEDLEKVPGFPAELIESLRGRITV